MEEQFSKILVVDDTEENIDLLVETLGDQYDLSIAMDGFRALEIVEEETPDLILLDVMMPEMDGFETCQRLKGNPKYEDIPIIFLTAKSATDDIVRGFEIGAVDYVTKPFNPPELISRVATHLLIQNQKKMISRKHVEVKQLLHILCHDLSNHFASVIMIRQLWEMNSPETLPEYRDKLKLASTNGVDVINLVKEMSALEEKKMDMESINLSLIIQQSYTLLLDKFNDKQVKLDIDIPDDMTVLVEKRSFLNSVVNNIFTNAIKFSFPNSSILVSAIKQNNNVVLKIKDTGVGMPKTLLDKIFDLSAKTSRKGTSGESGTGFGMPLIKKFVNLYGGTITVRSQEEKESTDNHGTEIILVLKSEI